MYWHREQAELTRLSARFLSIIFMDRYKGSYKMHMDNGEQDHYVGHLSEVNKSNRVLTSSDIKNSEGALVVSKGTPITGKISKKIINHKFIDRIESYISLEHSITPDDLIDELNQIIEAQENKTILQQESLIDLLRASCETLNKYPLLVQKFTVMQSRFPRLYKRTVGSSFVALIIAWKMDLPNRDKQHIFIAALMRDVGLLHIDPSLVEKRGDLTPNELRALQSHVAIGKVFLDSVPDLPKKVGRAVLEHHECSDGSGYPYGKGGDSLCIDGQVLAMADAVAAIYRKKVVTKSYALEAFIPILQINIHLYPESVYKAALIAVTYMANSLHRFYPDSKIPELCSSNILKISQLTLWLESADALTNHFVSTLPETKTSVILAIANRLHKVVDTSGLLTQENITWLQSVIDKSRIEHYDEVEQQVLMLEALQSHFRQWDLRLTRCIQNENIGSNDSNDEYSYEKLDDILNGKSEVLPVA